MANSRTVLGAQGRLATLGKAYIGRLGVRPTAIECFCSAPWARALTSTAPARSTIQLLACRQLPLPKIKKFRIQL